VALSPRIDSYRYLVESIRVHPSQEELKQLMQQVGFERVEYFNLAGGVVACIAGISFSQLLNKSRGRFAGGCTHESR
jgi:ubiquinone/menaquinone biosynthesis C-methylase UbiE